MAMIDYARTGEVPEFTGNERYIWPTLQAQLDRDIATYWDRCERNRKNGSKGGRGKKKETVTEETQPFSEEPTLSNKNENENENKNENKKESENKNKKESENKNKKENENKSESENNSTGMGPLFFPPTVEEVSEYCRRQGYGIDPGRFVDYYTANGWCMGTAPMKDWRAALKCWNGKEKRSGKDPGIPTWHIGLEL